MKYQLMLTAAACSGSVYFTFSSLQYPLHHITPLYQHQHKHQHLTQTSTSTSWQGHRRGIHLRGAHVAWRRVNVVR